MRVVFTIKKIFKSSFPLDMTAYTINSNHRYTQPGTLSLYFGDGEKTVYAELGSYKVTNYSNRTMHSYDAKLDNMLDLAKICIFLGIEINENKRKISSNILKQYIY